MRLGSTMRVTTVLSAVSCLWMLLGSAACGDDAAVGGSGGSGAASLGGAPPEGGSQVGEGGAATTQVDLKGGAQKGPFILGSSVLVSEVTASGAPTGISYETQTVDDAGHFDLSFVQTDRIAVAATGFYFNEVSGELSTAQITLRAFDEVAPEEPEHTTFINVLTHLTHGRVRALAKQTVPIPDAMAQAETELRVALGIGLPTFDPGVGGVALDQLGGDTDANAYLLGVSAVMVNAAVRAATSPALVDATLQQLIEQLSADLADDGSLEPERVAQIHDAELALDSDAVKANLAARLLAIGSAAEVPDLARVLDRDDDLVVDADDNCLAIENADQTDSDSDGFGDACPAKTGSTSWARVFGGADYDSSSRTAADPSGVYVTGDIYGDIDFGAGPVSCGTPASVYVAKLDTSGASVWAKLLCASNSVYVSDVRSDGSGLLLAGAFNGTVDFGDGPVTSTTPSMFVARLDPDGNLIWKRTFTSTVWAGIAAMATDVTGTIFVAGGFDGTIDLGGGPLSSETSGDLFLLALDATGNYTWAEPFAGASAQTSLVGIALAPTGNISLAGWYSGSGLDFGGGPLPTGAGYRGFVVELDSMGLYQWDQTIGIAGQLLPAGVARSADDGIVIAGRFVGTADFGGGVVQSSTGGTGESGFVAKLDQAGAGLWARVLDAQGYADVSDVAISLDDHVVVEGSFDSLLLLDGAPIPGAGARDVFAAKFDAEQGTTIWSRTFGGAGDEEGLGLAPGPNGSSIVVGRTASPTIDFGPVQLPTAGNYDAFVARLEN